MRLTLFQQVLQKLVGIRALDPRRHAPSYAEQLQAARPEVFAALDGPTARIAALEIATDHVREVCRLPALAESLQRSISVAALAPGERLVRITGLAYLTCDQDLIPDDLPAGYGLIDDCITFHGSELAAPRTLSPEQRERQRLLIRYLGVAVDDVIRGQIEGALLHAAEIALACVALPSSAVEAAIRNIIEEPPASFPINLELPEHPPIPAETRASLSLPAATVIEVRGRRLTLQFADGERLIRHDDGSLWLP